MKNADKLYRKIRKLSFEIAEESASYDPNNKCWWGNDTDIGDLPDRIQKRLAKFVDWLDETKKAKVLEEKK